MQAISVLSTPTLLAAAGNRDFLHIYNNGSETIFLCYDGTNGLVNSTVRNGGNIVSGNTYTTTTILSSTDIFPGMMMTGTGISPGAGTGPGPIITAVVNNGNGSFTVTHGSFTAGANNTFGGTIILLSVLTVDNGRPVPAGTWYDLNSDGTKAIFNKAVYAIAATGPVNVRIQGA